MQQRHGTIALADRKLRGFPAGTYDPYNETCYDLDLQGPWQQ
jgi:hypothetical protein